MPNLEDLEERLERFDTEVQAAWRDARARLGDSRPVKLGDLNLRPDLYQEMKPVFQELYRTRWLRRVLFHADSRGRQSRRLLLVFMSELVYWEYERSFWHKLYEVLETSKRNWHWFTDQMWYGYQENAIPLITWTGRNEYVRTIIAESGFSRRLVRQARQFVIWFFDHHSGLDPRSLDAASFDNILDEYGVWNKTEMFDLLRNMVDAVSRLLREIRKRSLVSADLRSAEVLNELEDALGFHPVRGIFGFRKEEDIQELLEQLSTRVKPDTFYRMLRRKTRARRAKLWIVAPEGNKIEVRQAKDVPIVFGEYQLIGPDTTGIQVVPRESLTLSKLAEMLRGRKTVFYQDGNYAWIHDDKPFEVYQGHTEPVQSRCYCIDALKGYLWYGKQKIGIPLRAERDGKIISDLDPRRDVWLNPRLRLSWDGIGLEVVIPSFVCFEPDFAGRTVRLELNSRPVENTTYVVGHDGTLQFQGTRVAKVHPEDKYLEVRLVALDGDDTVTKSTVCRSLEQDFLFSRGNRERIRPGEQHYGADRFVLFTATGASIEVGNGIIIESSNDFGSFKVRQLRWIPDPSDPQPFDLRVGELHWRFTQPLKAHTSLLCTPADGPFEPQEPNSVFDLNDVTISIQLRGHPEEVSEIWPKLSLIIEKDGEFLTDFSLTELKQMGLLRAKSVHNEFNLDAGLVVNYLIGQRLTDRPIGTYRCTLMIRPYPLADLEPISEMGFMLLPKLQAEGLNVPMAEGKESLVTILCDDPLLADEDDRPANILRLDCVPEADFDAKAACLRARPVQKNVRLIYPPAKVNLHFKPQLFAARLVCNGRARSRPRLAYAEAEESYLAVIAPPNVSVSVTGDGISDLVETNGEGQGRYWLAQLLPAIEEERTLFYVTCSDFQHQFEIVWYPKLQFDCDRCQLGKSTDGADTLTLYFNAEGPPATEISFSLADNQFRSYGQYSVKLASLAHGTFELPVDTSELQGASILYCMASAGGNRLDSVPIQLEDRREEDEEERLVQRLQAKLTSADLRELPVLVDALESMGKRDLMQHAFQNMYSVQRVDQVYREFKRKTLSQNEIAAYFERFNPSMLPDLKQVPIAKLKKCCAIPALKLQLACAEGLILQGDGVGVEEIVDLVSQGKVSWDRCIEALSKNEDCASEMIRDMVRWDDLEKEEDEYIDLMEKLSKVFHPAMTRRARAAKDWKRALELRDTEQIIDVEAISWNENGLTVPFGLISGLVPIQQLDTRRHGLKRKGATIRKRLHRMVNKTIRVTVIDANRRKGRLVLSETQARAKLAEELLTELTEGDIRRGVVTNVRDFGAFVDLGGVDGLIHISELSWEEVKHPRDILTVGDEIEVYILAIDREQRKVGLSLRKLLPDPWIQRAEKYEIGQVVRGRVTEITDFGAFVSIEAGIDGLVHISELSYRPISHPGEVVSQGETLTLRVLRMDEEKHRLILSLRQAGEDGLYWGHIRVKH